MLMVIVMQKLLTELKKYYAKHRRSHLPWRKTKDPYKILVSELMLQQTQVERVVPKYKVFIQKFPTVQSLSRAKLQEVLVLWQGLGYNRRAKFLYEASKIIAAKGFPQTVAEMEGLPGVGPYTARAISAFAYNTPEVFVETNIRTVFFHHLASRTVLDGSASDRELLPMVGEALQNSKMQPRDFYAALMDYGSFLKRSGVKLNSKSKHYTKQSKFEGSARQLRGAILRELLKRPQTLLQITKNLSRKRGEVEQELARLKSEGIVTRAQNQYRVGE